MERIIECSCENEIKTNFPEIYNLDEHPEVEKDILDGSFLSVKCDDCKRVLKLEVPVRIMGGAHELDIYLAEEKYRNTYLLGKYEIPDCKRVVFGYQELYEKILLSKNNLDDGIVEIMKFRLLEKQGEDSSIDIVFHALDDGAVIFHVYGLREDEVGVVKVPFNVYEKMLNQKDEFAEDFDILLTPPYVSAKKIQSEEGE